MFKRFFDSDLKAVNFAIFVGLLIATLIITSLNWYSNVYKVNRTVEQIKEIEELGYEIPYKGITFFVIDYNDSPLSYHTDRKLFTGPVVGSGWDNLIKLLKENKYGRKNM